MKQTALLAAIYLWMMITANAYAVGENVVVYLGVGEGALVRCSGNQIVIMPIDNRHAQALCMQFSVETPGAPTDTPFPTPIPTITAAWSAPPTPQFRDSETPINTGDATPIFTPTEMRTDTPAPTITPPPPMGTIETS